MSIAKFKQTTPVLLPEKFLAGRLQGWAVMEGFGGGLLRRASIAAVGEWHDAERQLHFTETYNFDDGHEDTLRWRIEPLDNGRYRGTETRLDGDAEGDRAGCAFHWRYTRDVPQADGSLTKLKFDDWFYLVEEAACIVRGSAGRAGLPFFTAHVTYVRL